MENTSHTLLSDYQRAILYEMGIISWQMVDEKNKQEKVDTHTYEVAATSPEITAKEEALAKLEKLKVETPRNEVTDSVLLTFSQSDTTLQILTDVLIALGLESKTQEYVTTEQLEHYSDYPLSWIQGDNVSFSHKQLITPAVAQLNCSDTKKQLWQQLQNVSSLAKI